MKELSLHQINRMLFIRDMIKMHGIVSRNAIEEKFEIAERTAKAILIDMRELGCQIEYNRKKKGYECNTFEYFDKILSEEINDAISKDILQHAIDIKDIFL